MSENNILPMLQTFNKSTIDTELSYLKNKHQIQLEEKAYETRCGVTALVFLRTIKKHFGIHDLHIQMKLINYPMILETLKNKQNFSILYVNNKMNHCFVINRMSDEKYILLQSYYEHYTLYDKNVNAIKTLNKSQAIEIMKKYNKLESKAKVDSEYIQIWKEMTGVDIKNQMGKSLDNQAAEIYLYQYSMPIKSKL